MADTKGVLISDEMSERIIETAGRLATSEGANAVNVRKILRQLNITNRVFYNRFHNLEEVLEIVYNNTILKIREGLLGGIDPTKDFFEQIINIVERTLIMSYDAKMQLNHFVFQNDSVSNSNFKWWTTEIKKIIEYAKEKHYIKDIDSDTMSYVIWCFIRGFNADAVARKFPKAEAVQKFRYGFSILLEGMKV